MEVYALKMKDNVEEMLIYYSNNLDFRKAIAEEVKVYVSDNVVVSVKEASKTIK